MAEQNPEQVSQTPSFEKSNNIASVVAATVAATQKIGAAIMKITRDIVGMIVK